jgi:hypothetical protein
MAQRSLGTAIRPTHAFVAESLSTTVIGGVADQQVAEAEGVKPTGMASQIHAIWLL